MIKLGVCQWIMDRGGVDSVARAAELGFEGIQLGIAEDNVEIRRPALQQAYLRASQETGVEIVGFGINTMNELPLYSPPDSSEGHRCRDLLRSALDTALAMGVGLVYCPAFFAAEIRTDEQLERAAATLRSGCEYIEGQPVLLATENTLDVSANLRLMELIGHASMRVLIDSYNPFLFGHQAASLVRQLPARYQCNQMHAKDGRGRVMGNVALGRGECHFDEFVRALKDIKFDGWLISETDYRSNADELATADLARLKELLA